MSLPRYPAYKATGIEWLTYVPQHWGLSRLGFESWVRARLGWKGLKAEEYVDNGYAFLATPNIKGRDIDFRNVNYITKERYDESPEIKLTVGDVLLAKDGSTLGTVNVVRELPCDATVNSSIAVITPHASLSGIFLHYLFQSDFLVNTIQRIKGGMGVPHLFQEDLNKFYIPLPPIEEQSVIADFLDHETAKIDALIAEQEKLLILLAEKRQATLLQAVTRGVIPDVPLKDSGVAWLGEVPAHWRVCPLKLLGRVGNGSTPNRDNPNYWAESGFPWLNSSVANLDEVVQADQFVTQLALQECHLPIVEPPAVLVGITGQGKTRGMATKLMFIATVNQHLAYIKTSESKLTVSFLLRVLEMAYHHLRTESDGVGSTKGAITCEQLGRLAIPLPDVEEQGSIAAFLDTETAKLDTLKAEAERAIALLKERRSGLIAAAVTGKIDVRNAVPQELAA